MQQRFRLFIKISSRKTFAAWLAKADFVAATDIRSHSLGSTQKLTQCARLLFCSACLMLGPWTALAVAAEAPDTLRETAQALQQLPVGRQDPAIPAEVKPLLAKLKRQLRDLLGATLNAQGTETDSLPAIRSVLVKELAAHQIAYDTPEIVTISGDEANVAEADTKDFAYGRLQQIAIDKPSGHTDLLAVTVRFSVVCGSDTSLYIFKKQGGRWSLLIEQDAGEYDSISDVLGEFQYAISQPENSGDFYVVTKSVNPWCTSNWQTLRYQVMRAGPSPTQPRVILQRDEPVFLGNGDSGWLALSSSGFRLEYDSWQGLGEIVRRHIAAYQIVGDTARQVPPLAHAPEDFLDAWFALPWEEASRWIHPGAARTLHRIHSQIHTARNDDRQSMQAGFVFDPAACRVSPNRWQVGIDATFDRPGRHASETSLRQFFIVTREGDHFAIHSASRSVLPRCRVLQASD